MSFLEFQGLSKSFPGVQALSDVTFSVERGQCHALIGENGAGKSTIGKILAGVITADAGTIRMEGQVIAPRNPLEARALGIAMVHQELAFCPNLSVAENLCLGNLPQRAGWVDRREMQRQAGRMLEEVQADFDLERPIAELSTGQEQLVQIAAALGTGARIIVMDEPTSSLSAHESESLFKLLGELEARGITVIYVSHRMEEIFRLCHAVTVLRDGRHVKTQSTKEITTDQIVQQMIGRAVNGEESLAKSQEPSQPETPPLLSVHNLESPGKFSGVSFELRPGEILGLGGLVGAGRSEVAQAIFGLDRGAVGRLEVAGVQVPLGSVEASLASGIGLVPEDRKRQGLVLSMNCRENGSLASLFRVTRGGWISRSSEQELVARYAERLRVKTPSLEVNIASLSGGNQQKVALLKWVARQCKILIVDEPTRGVDVGAKSEIHLLLRELASQGVAILLISSEMPELLSLSHRILILREGKSQGFLERSAFSQEAVMRRMAGLTSH